VNAPVGALVGLTAARVLPPDRPGERRSLDPCGLATGLPGLALVVYGLARAAGRGWANPIALGTLAAGVALLAGFLVIEARVREPMLPPQVLAHRDRAFALAGVGLMAFTLTSFLFFSTQFLQHVKGLSALATGLAYLPFGIALMLAARYVPRLIVRLSPQLIARTGFLLMTVGAGGLSGLHQATSYPAGLLGPMILLGAGAGLAVVPLNIIALSSAAPQEKGVVSAAVQASLSVGGSLGLAVMLTVFSAGHHDIANAVARTFAGAAIAAAAGGALAATAWLTARRAR
jgi:predicted MFS family arabinose efflux permease